MTIPSNPSPGEIWTNDVTGVSYRWDDDRWVVVSASSDDLDDYVKTVTFEADQKRQDDDIEAGFDTQGSILIKNIEQDQTLGVHSGQINALETQVQLLAGVRAVGRWTYRRRVESNSPRPPADSCFYGTHKDDISTILRNWSDINLLMINKTDLDGNTFAFSQFEEGDKVEVIASDGSSAVYGTVTNNPSNDVYANMILAVERSNGGPVEEKEYLISAYRPGSSNGDVDLDILDGRYLIRTGDDMDKDSYLSFPGGGVKFYGENDPKKSVIYNANDSVTQWTAYNGTSIKITARDGDPGNGRTFIDMKTVDSSGTQGADDGYRMKLYHVATPTEDFHGANKKYVDESVISSGISQARWTNKGSSYDTNALVAGECKSRVSGSGTNWTWELYIAHKALINGQEIYWFGENTHFPSAVNGTEYIEDLAGQIVSLFEVPSVGTPAMFATGRIKSGYPKFNRGSTNYVSIQADHVRSRGYSPSTSTGGCIITLSPWLPIIYS